MSETKYLDFLLNQEDKDKKRMKRLKNSKAYKQLVKFADQINEYLEADRCSILLGTRSEHGQLIICILATNVIFRVWIKDNDCCDECHSPIKIKEYLFEKIEHLVNSGVFQTLKGYK